MTKSIHTFEREYLESYFLDELVCSPYLGVKEAVLWSWDEVADEYQWVEEAHPLLYGDAAELRHDEEWASQPPYYFSEEALRFGPPFPGPIQPVWWHQCWIPIAADLGGNLSCVDLVPAPGGMVGQIIDWDHECGPSRVLFPSFTHLLTALADEMQARLDR